MKIKKGTCRRYYRCWWRFGAGLLLSSWPVEVAHLALIDINPQALEETRVKVQQAGD